MTQLFKPYFAHAFSLPRWLGAAAFSFLVLTPLTYAAEPYCDTGQRHPIDLQLEHDLSQNAVTTADMREAQGKAYTSWDKELNREYKELMALLSDDEKNALRQAQRAWLAFRDAETEFWWSESISDGGSLAPVIVSDHAIELLKARVCQLARYKKIASRFQ